MIWTCPICGLACVPLKFICLSPNLQHLRMWPFWDIGSLQIQFVKMKSYWHTVSPSSNMTSVLVKRGSLHARTHTREATWRLWVTLPQGKELPQIGERPRDNPSLVLSEEAQSCWHLDLELVASRTVRQYISIVLSHPVCGTSSPRKLTQWPKELLF